MVDLLIKKALEHINSKAGLQAQIEIGDWHLQEPRDSCPGCLYEWLERGKNLFDRHKHHYSIDFYEKIKRESIGHLRKIKERRGQKVYFGPHHT